MAWSSWGAGNWWHRAGGLIAAQADRYLLGALLQPQFVGFYTIAQRLEEAMYIGVLKVGEILFPFFSTLQKEADDRKADLLFRSSWILNVLAASALGGLIPVAGPLLHLWTGAEVATEAQSVLVILSIAGILGSSTNVFAFYLLAQGAVELECPDLPAHGRVHAGDQRDRVAVFRMAGGGMERLFRHDCPNGHHHDPAAAAFQPHRHVVASDPLRVDAAWCRHRNGAGVAIWLPRSATRPGSWLVVRGGRLFHGGRYHLPRRGRGFAGRPLRGCLLAGSPRHRRSLPAAQGDLRNVRNCRYREPPRQCGRTGGNLATDEPGRASRTLWRGQLVQREPQSALFGHRRLAIIDPGDGGYQPMVSADGRHVIVFNGEIYNFLELRRELEAQGAVFRSQSDTEVILAAWRAWQEGMLPRFNGMWALAIFDTQTEGIVSGARPLRHQAAAVCVVVGALCLCIRAARIGAKRPDHACPPISMWRDG